jgi:short-subunit dehydrogenase
MARKTALITGASSGIGETFARKLAARGYDLILVARREERLQKIAGDLAGATALAADLATSEGIAKVENAIVMTQSLELLVNNAGFGTIGRFWTADRAGQERMLDVHIRATMRLTHSALRGMVRRGSGAVVNVSSVAAFGQSAGNVSYCASKAWINSFSEGLDLELREARSPVTVQALCPGFTVTEFHDTLGVDRKLIPGWLWMTADRVVEASLRGLERRRVIVVPGWRYKAAVTVMRHAPAIPRLVGRFRRDKRV